MADEEFVDGVDAQVERANSRASSPEPSYATETEREVAQVFAEMLQAKRVFREDDVFTLGGDSFEAVRIALELEYRFNVDSRLRCSRAPDECVTLPHGSMSSAVRRCQR